MNRSARQGEEPGSPPTYLTVLLSHKGQSYATVLSFEASEPDALKDFKQDLAQLGIQYSYCGSDKSAAITARREAGTLGQLIERLSDAQVAQVLKGVVFDILMQE